MRDLKAAVAAAAVTLLRTSCVRMPGPTDGRPANDAARRQVIPYDIGIRRAMFGEGRAGTPVREVITNVDESGAWGYGNPEDDFAVGPGESSDPGKTLRLRIGSPRGGADGSVRRPPRRGLSLPPGETAGWRAWTTTGC
ncbi:hypothetical protein [Kitasatospora phosalacinea]|uniref:Uncharacterized protein n=1 Tax=Kitasatospora phosalacinea TaxID=2065 RepID=A0A9W6UJR2_9ACTN|nr:hypothetical protein [Kitasatospora phosalacinea]GLW52676.1 hypothetical protein Kpho01_06870 [Kitasatospora phosalacinea]